MDEHYLAHYGVLGMKWGRRRARSHAAKAAKLTAKADKRSAKALSQRTKVKQKSYEYMTERDKSDYKSKKYKRLAKIDKTLGRMDDYESNSRKASEHLQRRDKYNYKNTKLLTDYKNAVEQNELRYKAQKHLRKAEYLTEKYKDIDTSSSTSVGKSFVERFRTVGTDRNSKKV